MLINEFYANREVFITGGTGFLGKALVEKLLRDCPKIKVIYLLLRGKRSLSIEERLQQLRQDKVFDCIKEKNPEVLNKLHAIQGDSQELGLAIQSNDLKLLKNVSVIFHMAANVRFDDPLRSSILLNTRGTYELIKIAETFKNLVAFLHCSTAFCNALEDVIEEKVYEIPTDWQKSIKIAETYDEETFNCLSYKYTGFYPNNYTFTKNLSEQIIKAYSTKLPMIVFRPSVVIGAYKEPMPGWVDNLNGPIAAMIGQSIGILPVAYSSGKLKLDSVPIDLVTKLTIVAAYKRSMQTLRKESIPNDLEVINCVSNNIFNLNFYGASALMHKAAEKNPLEYRVWDYDYPLITSCYYNFFLKVLFMSIPHAFILDIILRLVGRKPLMIKFSRRIVYSMGALMYFVFKEYKMHNKNMLDLEKFIPESEIAIYGIKNDIKNFDFAAYFEKALAGIKYYILNQPTEATAGARKRAKILFIASRSIKLFTFTLFSFYLWSLISKLLF